MMARTPVSLEEPVCVLAPTGRDAELTCAYLRESGIHAVAFRDMTGLTEKLDCGCAAIILAEEVLGPQTVEMLIDRLSRQPSWSEIPLCVITSGGQHSADALRKLIASRGTGNVTVLDRPFRAATLLNAIEVVLGSRRRQYQVRDLLAERERILTSLEGLVEQRTASLLETNAQLEAFCYTIAHDLRAPLRAQQGFAAALMDEYGERLDDLGRNYAERIFAAAGRLDALVNDLLAYARLSRTEMEAEPVVLQRIVMEVREEMEFELRDETLEIGDLNFTALGHAPTLKTAITNLFSNALKFTRPDVVPRIVVGAEERDGRVRLRVEDNGIGIAPEHCDDIFGVFSRLHRADRYPGTGVGLAIVRKAIERMGGRAGVNSVEGVGSEFWIELLKAE